MRKIYLHVGYPKTGTTSLQWNLFRRHSQIFNVRSQIEEIDGVRRAILGESDRALQEYQDVLAPSLRSNEEKKIVYSEEDFTQDVEGNGHKNGVTLEDIPARLYEVFGGAEFNVEIILVIRRQQDIIKSAYSFFLDTYKSLGYDDINHLVYDCLSSNGAPEILDWVNYVEKVNSYVDVFGEKSVNVLVYEKLKNCPKKFIINISEVVGVSSQEAVQLMGDTLTYNSSQTNGDYYESGRLYRFLSTIKSQYFPKMSSVRGVKIGEWFVNLVKSQKGRKIEFTEDSLSRLKAFYGPKNKRLEEEYNIPCSRFGYFV